MTDDSSKKKCFVIGPIGDAGTDRRNKADSRGKKINNRFRQAGGEQAQRGWFSTRPTRRTSRRTEVSKGTKDLFPEEKAYKEEMIFY